MDRPHARLLQLQRRLPPWPVHHRNRLRHRTHHRHCAAADDHRPVGVLPLARHRRPDFPRLSMGCPASRSRISRHSLFTCPLGRLQDQAIAHRAVSDPLAALSPDVPLRARQMVQRRRILAEHDRPSLPFRNPAHPHLDKLVRSQRAALDARLRVLGDVLHRRHRPLPLLRSAAHAHVRILAHRAIPAHHHGDRKLRLFQPARDRARLLAAG